MFDFIAAKPVNQRQLFELEEHLILQLLAEGNSNKEVAAKLTISVKTAETHRSRIMAKLHLGSVSGLVRYAVRNGIVEA